MWDYRFIWADDTQELLERLKKLDAKGWEAGHLSVFSSRLIMLVRRPQWGAALETKAAEVRKP